MTGNDAVRERMLPERVTELMTWYTNVQLASYDAVAPEEFTAQEQGEDVLAQITPRYAQAR